MSHLATSDNYHNNEQNSERKTAGFERKKQDKIR